MTPWPRVALGEIFDIARGGSPRPIDNFITDDPDGVNWVTISDASNETKYITKTKRKIKPSGVARSRTVGPGDFLLTNSMSFGRPYIMRTSGCIHDGWLVLSPRNGATDQDYFYHLLSSDEIYERFAQLASGATVKNLNIDLVTGVEVQLPPLPEQRRIAAILDQADALRAKRRAALALLDEMAQAIFLDAFGVAASWKTNFSFLPFGEVCETKLGKMLDHKRQAGNNPTPYLRNVNVRWFRIDTTDVKTMDFSPAERKIFALEKGDILICEGGEPGRAAIWHGEPNEYCFQKALHRVRPNSQIVLPEFLVWMLWQLAHEGGLKDYVTIATIAHLTKEKLDRLPTPIPPMPLQKQFVKRMKMLGELRRGYVHSSSILENLFASLQHRAFRGEL